MEGLEEQRGNEMVRLLGLNGEASVRMIEAVKSFLEKLWHIRNRE